MVGNNTAIKSFSRIVPIDKLNENFTLCECYAFALGKNRNYSHISKEAAERAFYGLDYLPIVAHIMQDEDGKYYIGGHDYELVIDDSQWKFKPLTVPVGVVIANTAEYREVEEYGKAVTYVVVKCVLWTEHYPELLEAAYSDETYFSQSMEIEIKQSRPLEEDSNYSDILDFSFLKLCLLGLSDNPEHNTEPCFISAQVAPTEFALDDKLPTLMAELKTMLDNYFEKQQKEGVRMTEEMKLQILEEFGLQADEFTIEEDMDEAAFREAVKAYAESKQPDAPAVDPVVEPENFKLSYELSHDDIRRQLYALLNGDSDRYEAWIVEVFDGHFIYEQYDENKFFDRGYTKNGDEISLAGEPVEVFATWLSAEDRAALDALKNSYEGLKSDYEALEQECEELRSYKSAREEEQHKANVDSLLADFSELANIPEFAEFAVEAYKIHDLKEIECKCFELKGRFGKFEKTEPKEPKTVKVKVPAGESHDNDHYGDFFERFGHKN